MFKKNTNTNTKLSVKTMQWGARIICIFRIIGGNTIGLVGEKTFVNNFAYAWDLYFCPVFSVCICVPYLWSAKEKKTLSEKATRTRAARQRPQFGFLCQRLEMFWNNKWFLTISDNWKKKRNKLDYLDLPYEWLFGVWHDPRIIWCSWLIIYEEWPILHKSACRN